MFDSINTLTDKGLDSPIILLFGDDEFSREEAQDKIINMLVASEDDKFNFDAFDGESASLNNIIELCMSYPMMSDKRVVLVKRFDKLFQGRVSKKVETSSAIANYLNNPLESTKLILTAELESAKDVYKTFKSSDKEKFIKKVAALKFPFNKLILDYKWMEFPRVYESEYPKWTKDKFKCYGKNIQPEAVDILLSRTKQTLRDISNEVEKIVIAIDKKNDITIEDINFITGSNREFTVFELQKQIADRNISKVIFILNKMLSVDKQEMLIMAIISKFFINLLKISEEFRNNASPQALASKLGISPFQFSDYSNALRKYTLNDIENAILYLFETDLKLKSSGYDNLSVIQEMFINIVSREN